MKTNWPGHFNRLMNVYFQLTDSERDADAYTSSKSVLSCHVCIPTANKAWNSLTKEINVYQA